MTTHIILEAEDFDHLIRGGELQTRNGDVCIIMADIGWSVLERMLQRVMDDRQTRLAEIQVFQRSTE